MIAIKTNSSEVLGRLIRKLNNLKETDALLRTLATDTRAAIRVRVHTDGLASDGKQIGTYSAAYMKVRTGNFQNSKKSKSGKLKNSGTFTKQGVSVPFSKSGRAFTNIESENKPRPNYHRTADTKVVISLTRRTENDEVVIPTGRGYAVGFLNIDSAKKARYVELTYKKRIFSVTTEEIKHIRQVAKKFIDQKNGGI